MQYRVKLESEVWAEDGREGGDILSKINAIPFSGGNMFLISDYARLPVSIFRYLTSIFSGIKG